MNGNSDAQPLRLPHDCGRPLANTNIHTSDTKMFRAQSAENTHLLISELLSLRISLRQHEETQASILQEIEKV
jgi:hypothetical protein